MERISFVVVTAFIVGLFGISLPCAAQEPPDYKYRETKNLVSLVRDAATAVATKGENAFPDFKKEGTPWRQGKEYIFIMDISGNMIVHPDPAIEGKNQINMMDINDKPVIKGIIEATDSVLNRNEGWYHYQWPEPGTIFSSWNSTFAKRVVAPSGKVYVVCSGMYNPKMEDAFIVGAVDAAVALIEKEGTKAFGALRDKSSQFVFLGTYIFVDTPEGIEVVNGGFPDIEGKNILDYKDSNGKYVTRDIVDIAMKKGSGWLNYLWPKPGETKPSKKHTYVKKALYGGKIFAVGSGAYLKDEFTPVREGAGGATTQFIILELTDGSFCGGRMIRQTKGSIFLAGGDGSTEVWIPRSKIASIRNPTDSELEKLSKGTSLKYYKPPREAK